MRLSICRSSRTAMPACLAIAVSLWSVACGDDARETTDTGAASDGAMADEGGLPDADRPSDAAGGPGIVPIGTRSLFFGEVLDVHAVSIGLGVTLDWSLENAPVGMTIVSNDDGTAQILYEITAADVGTTYLDVVVHADAESTTFDLVVKTTPAFPGAVGFGATTVGGRFGALYRVTSLADAGPGTLREACEASGSRIVIFETSGLIPLERTIEITNPYLTIAAETAPSPGITLKGGTLVVATHDVVIRHLRSRAGDEAAGTSWGGRDCFSVADSGGPVHDIIFDHVSGSWAIDEVFDIWNGPNTTVFRDMTFSHSIAAEGLSNSVHPPGPGEHSKGFLISAGVQGLSVFNNLFAHNNMRNVNIHQRSHVLVQNNIMYNWGEKATHIHPQQTQSHSSLVPDSRASVINNLYIVGVDDATSPAYQIFVINDLEPGVSHHLYFAGNRKRQRGVLGDALVVNWSPVEMADTPPISHPRVPMVAADTLETTLLPQVGARPLDRDIHDTRVVTDVTSGTGSIIDSQSEVGGWGTIAVNTVTHRLPEEPSAVDPASGYSNVEIWIHTFADALVP